MKNIVLMNEKLKFGKFKGITGAELLKSAEGSSYLGWVWKNTDIRIDVTVISCLISGGFIDNFKANEHVRTNSLENSPVVIISVAQVREQFAAFIDAYNNK